MLLTFTWNPDRFIFTIPYIDRPIAWYGALFVSGFIVSYYVLIPLLIKHYAFSKNEAKIFLDRFCWYCILGTIVGARLGYILFYALPSFLKNPLDVFQVWKGGLASHGGVIGIAVALVLFRKSIKKSYPHITLIKLLDLAAASAAFTCGMIRLGNFINQEIVGTKTTLPWGVAFGNPSFGTPFTPRHPVQLYEALAYFSIFALLYTLSYKKLSQLVPGVLINTLFVLSFISRFFLEFFKEPTNTSHRETFLLTGQWLSLPFIALGLLSLYYLYRKNANSFWL